LGATEGGNDEDQAGPDPGAQAEGQTGTDAGTRDEGQAGSNPDEMFEGQAGRDPGNAGDEEQTIPSHVVHAGSDREHMDLDVADDPASSSGSLSSLQQLSKDISFGDLFFSDKPSKAENGKTTTETKAESMVSVNIQQDMSSIPPMTSPIIDLSSRPKSPKVHQQFQATTTETTTTTTTTLPPPPTQQQSNAEAMMIKRISELEHIMTNLIQVNKEMEARLDKHGARLYTLEQLDIPQQVSKVVSEVVTKAVDWAMQAPLRNRFRDLPEADMKEILHQRMNSRKTWLKHERKRKRVVSHLKCHMAPPPPPSSTSQECPPKGSAAPSSSKTAASAEYHAWTTTGVRLRPSISLTPADLEMDEDMGPDDQAQLSDDEDIEKPAWSIPSSDAHVPPNNWASALVSSYSPPSEDSLLVQTGDIATFIDWFCKRRGITELKPQDLEGPAFEIIKVFHPDVIHLQYQMEVSIQSDFFFNKDLEYLRYGSKGNRPALSILKMKASYYPDAGLEQMVSNQFWIEKECKYDIAAMYGISHWWFQRQRFYIDRRTSEGDRGAVRTHIWILSVVRIEVFSLYGYDYMKKIVLRRADLNEHVIAERDFKYLYPCDLKDLYLLNLQGHLNHLPPKDKKILSTATQLNLTKPQWDATGFEYKHDYTVIDSPRAVMFRDKYGVKMMMRFKEIHKYSDGTLQQIEEALDYRVKEFRINRINPCLNTRFWTRKDVDRSKVFMFAIQRRLKTRRIFCNPESFVGGRLREGDYRLLKRIE
nr:hypothetical protein [Tanacetum cinerariifolium]